MTPCWYPKFNSYIENIFVFIWTDRLMDRWKHQSGGGWVTESVPPGKLVPPGKNQTPGKKSKWPEICSMFVCGHTSGKVGFLVRSKWTKLEWVQYYSVMKSNIPLFDIGTYLGIVVKSFSQVLLQYKSGSIFHIDCNILNIFMLTPYSTISFNMWSRWPSLNMNLLHVLTAEWIICTVTGMSVCSPLFKCIFGVNITSGIIMLDGILSSTLCQSICCCHHCLSSDLVSQKRLPSLNASLQSGKIPLLVYFVSLASSCLKKMKHTSDLSWDCPKWKHQQSHFNFLCTVPKKNSSWVINLWALIYRLVWATLKSIASSAILDLWKFLSYRFTIKPPCYFGINRKLMKRPF